MTIPAAAQRKSFVILPLGGRSVSFPAESVIELVAPGKLQTFPHRTPWISGVIVRRGRTIPVCDLSRLLSETSAAVGRFYLIVEWRAGGTFDWCAIPVAGECELASAEEILPVDALTASEAPHITGFLQVAEERLEILDLAKLIDEHRPSLDASAAESAS
ncbi:MAG TPA: chemotaxis protein CheW [Candidatus Acidoferrales bacterium]|nr:chemotaxis protein CheW [Candidatus Acidoferrales bacterium]